MTNETKPNEGVGGRTPSTPTNNKESLPQSNKNSVEDFGFIDAPNNEEFNNEFVSLDSLVVKKKVLQHYIGVVHDLLNMGIFPGAASENLTNCRNFLKAWHTDLTADLEKVNE